MMTVHTFSASKRLTDCEFFSLVKECFEYCKLNNKKIYSEESKNHICRKEDLFVTHKCKYKYIVCNALEDIGVIIGFKSYISNKPNNTSIYRGIEIRVNPRRSYEDNYIGLSKLTHIKSFINIFNNKINEISKFFPEFDEFNISRIDYCINYYCNNSQEREEIFEIIRRSSISGKRYERYIKYNEKSKRKEAPKDSIYLYNKSVKINIYPKYNQMINEGLCINQRDLEQVKRIIRFEIQVERGKISDIKKKNNFENLAIETFLIDDIFKYIFRCYLKSIFINGDYYKYDKAKELINSSNKISNKEKLYALYLLKLITRARSIENAKKEFLKLEHESLTSEKKLQLFNKRLKIFSKIRLNPVTIPKSWSIEKVQAPLTLLRLYNN